MSGYRRGRPDYYSPQGQPVGLKSLDEIKELITATKLPFLVKGIMTPDEAELALAAGAAAIVVSNHGGRGLDSTPDATDVLPAIADRVKGRLLFFADGGVRSGSDVLKLLPWALMWCWSAGLWLSELWAAIGRGGLVAQ